MSSKNNHALESYGGYSVGDEVFVKRYPDSKLGHGPIKAFHSPKGGDNEVYFDFTCDICKQFRLGRVSDIIKKPTRAHVTKLREALTSKRKRR